MNSKSFILKLSFLFLLVFFTPGLSFAQEIISFRQMENILEEIEDTSSKIRDAFDDFLDDEDREPAIGIDLKFQESLKVIHEESKRLEELFETEEKRSKLETYVIRFRRRFNNGDMLFERVHKNEEVKEFWERLNKLVLSFEMAFFGDAFQGRKQTPHSLRIEDYTFKKVRRLSSPDIQYTREAIDELVHLSDQLDRQFEGDELMIRFDGAIDELKDTFNRRKNKYNIRPELKTVFRLAKELHSNLDSPQTPENFISLWQQIEIKLDILAEIYDFDKINPDKKLF